MMKNSSVVPVQYDQYNGALDDLYIAPMGHSANYNDNTGAAATNNFPTFS
jgi:hypothetical protein